MRLPAQKKLEIVQQILAHQTTVSTAAIKYKVSRKTIYQWLKRYTHAHGRARLRALGTKYIKGLSHPKYFRASLKNQLFHAIIKDPHSSLTQLAKTLGAGRHGVYNLLKDLKLTQTLDRQNFTRLYNAPKRLHLDIKAEVVRGVLNEGKTVTSAGREYHLARKTIYDWIRQYKATNRVKESYLKGLEHPRAISTPTRRKILEYIVRRPDFSIHQLCTKMKGTVSSGQSAKSTTPLSSHGIWRVLKEYGLTHKSARLAYAADTQKPQNLLRPFIDTDRVKSVLPKFIPQLAPAPPPGSQQNQPLISAVNAPEYIPLSRQFILKILIKSIFKGIFNLYKLPFSQQNPIASFTVAFVLPVVSVFFVSGIWNYFLLILFTQSLAIRTGYIFASLALTFGFFFFLYSLKYYLSVIFILLFTRQTMTREGQQLNSNSKQFMDRPGLIPDISAVTLERQPFVSIHVPLYNEKRVVNRLLDAVTSMEYDNFEVIVCDDSTDETKDIVLEWKNHPKIKISHRESRIGFKGGALQEAVKMMDPRTEFVLVFDADFLPYPDTITSFLKYFQVSAGSLDYVNSNHQSTNSKQIQNTNNQNTKTFGACDLEFGYSRSPVAAVQGYQWHVLNKGENWITRGVRTEYAGSYVVERSSNELYRGLKQISGSVFMIRADIIKRLGWGTSITEDFQLTLRLYEHGYKVVYTPYVQAPSECVSTIKRLVRQRMRWAEGHSHNIRKHFIQMLFGKYVENQTANPESKSLISNYSNYSKQAPNPNDQNQTNLNINTNIGASVIGDSLGQLRIRSIRNSKKNWLPSRLTTNEKLEFLYLAPYYLQSAFFLAGTLFWFISEAIFQVRLPFWTAVWGWSLVLTNLLSLPLMNTVGMFLEESEEKDYLGILSFVLLTYIVAPFQAYASVKGFLESSEGPWFRTPKTGKITDIYKRGRFYGWLAGLIPNFTGTNTSNKINQSSLLNPPNRKLLNYNNTISKIARKRNYRTKILSFSLTIILLLTNFGLYTLSSQVPFLPVNNILPNLQIKTPKNHFQSNEKPKFNVFLDKSSQSANNFISTAHAQETPIQAVVFHDSKKVEIPVNISQKDAENFDVSLDSLAKIDAGKYSLVITAGEGSQKRSITQDFTWGVLAINPDMAIYPPNSLANLAISVLDDQGMMVCDAEVELIIQNSRYQINDRLTTKGGTIKVSPDCKIKSGAHQADYQAYYQLKDAGIYSLKLSAQVDGVTRTIEDNIQVVENNTFYIKRLGPTRVFPGDIYQMEINIIPKADFRGSVVETIPQEFTIKPAQAEKKENSQQVVWKVDWQQGKTYQLKYSFQPPNTSPQFFQLEPLKILDVTDKSVYNEGRSWQIAVDAATIVESHYRWRNDDGGEGGSNTITYQEGNSWGTDSTTDDTYINSEAATTNYGTGTSFSVDGATPHGHGLIKFPNIIGTGVNQIPAGSTIYSAMLEMYVTNATVTDPTVYQVTEAWTESQTTWNVRVTGTNWTNAGCDGTTSHASASLGSFSTGNVNEWGYLDVATAVQNWSNGQTNEGLVLIDNNVDGAVYSSSENATTANRPKLTVIYSHDSTTSSYSLTPSADTYLSSAAPTTNYGSTDPVMAHGNTDRGILLKWDVSSISSSSIVVSATLTVNVTNASTDTYDLYEMRRAWTEAGATWNTYDGTNNWGTAGAANTTSDRYNTMVGAITAPATGSKTVSLDSDGVAMIQAWVSGTRTNYGLTIQDYATTDGLSFSSKENGTAGNRPTLLIKIAPTGATFAKNEDTTLDAAVVGTIYRLRFLINNSGDAAANQTYQLQVAETSTCSSGSYAAVPTDTSGDWQIAATSNITDGLKTTNISSGLTDVGTTFKPGELRDSANTTNSINLGVSEFTELEFAVKATSNATTNGDYCFRLSNVNTYTVYAQAKIIPENPLMLGLLGILFLIGVFLYAKRNI